MLASELADVKAEVPMLDTLGGIVMLIILEA